MDDNVSTKIHKWTDESHAIQPQSDGMTASSQNSCETKKNSFTENESDCGYDSQASTFNVDVECGKKSNGHVSSNIFCANLKRYEALICISLIGFLSMACYDLPGSMETEIQTNFQVSTSEFELLYTVYCIPNIFLAFFGGFLIDRILGVKKASLIVVFIATIGQILFTIGGFVGSFSTLLVARFIYGMGGDSIMVVCNYYLVMWFTGKEMNFVFGIIFSMARLGTSFIFYLSSKIYAGLEIAHEYPFLIIGSAFSTSMFMIAMIVLTTILLAWETKRSGKMINNIENKDSDKSGCKLDFLKEIKYYSIKYWLASIIFNSFNTAVLAFVTCSQGLLMKKYNISSSAANDLGSAFNLILSLTAPVAGFLVDTVGKKINVVTAAFILAVLSTMIMAFVNCNPYFPLVMFSASSGILFATALPLISQVVPPSQLGSAFGLVVSFSDLALSVCNIFVGYLFQQHGVEATCFFFAALFLVGLVSSIALMIIDFKEGGALNKWCLNISLNKKNEG